MKEFRSKSCKDGRMQIESYYYYPGVGKLTSMHHDPRRCYSSNPNPNDHIRESRLKNSKSFGGGSSSGSKNWSLSDPELQRMKRVASYRAYDVEGKVKGSLKKGLKWVKNHVVYGWW